MERFRDIAAIAAAEGNLTIDQVTRIERFGMNAYNDNTAEDEEEHWHNQIEHLPTHNRKDLAWLTKNGSLDIKIKLAHLVVAFKYRGHRTSLADLKRVAASPAIGHALTV